MGLDGASTSGLTAALNWIIKKITEVVARNQIRLVVVLVNGPIRTAEGAFSRGAWHFDKETGRLLIQILRSLPSQVRLETFAHEIADAYCKMGGWNVEHEILARNAVPPIVKTLLKLVGGGSGPQTLDRLGNKGVYHML